MGTDQAWKKWGSSDPYFGVLSDSKFSGVLQGDVRDEFFASGDKDIAGILDRYTRTFGPYEPGSALDFGCGVGRLTLALGRRFQTVLGLDVSQGMLDEARINGANVPGVSFALSDDTLSAAKGTFDFVNTLIVLQHIPPRRGVPIIAQLLDRVAPGGGCSIHFSIKRQLQPLQQLGYIVRNHVPGGNAAINLVRGRRAGHPPMQMNEYPVHEVLELFAERGMRDLLVTTSDQVGVMTMAVCGRRPI